MNTFTIEEIDKIQVKDYQPDFKNTQINFKNDVSITGLEDFARRAFNNPYSRIFTFARIDIRKRAATHIAFLAQNQGSNDEPDRELTLILSHDDGRMIFIQMLKTSSSFKEYVNKAVRQQVIADNSKNKELWWSIMTTNDRDHTKNSYCVQGDINDCKRKIQSIASFEAEKYSKKGCYASPIQDSDFRVDMDTDDKLAIRTQSFYTTVFGTEFQIFYQATAKC